MLKNPAAAAVARLAKPKVPKDHFERLFAFQCRALRLPEFRQQFQYAKEAIGRKWQADFYFPSYHLLVEINGGIWMGGQGAHSRPANIQRDMEKLNAAALLGLWTLEFTTKEVTNGAAVAFTQKVLTRLGWKGAAH